MTAELSECRSFSQLVKDGKLPRGSLCLPVITELMKHFLDIRLVKLATRHKCTYTRYADDITISTNQREFPSALAELDGTEWKVGEELVSRINDAGFEVNDAKTRMQLRGSRQMVTRLAGSGCCAGHQVRHRDPGRRQRERSHQPKAPECRQ